MILIIDNYDSFTFNLYQYFSEYADVIVKRNDIITISDIKNLNPHYIVISPGPGRPKNTGICNQVIKCFKKNVPILGVCLGHQYIASVFRAKIIRSKKILHGKVSEIHYNSNGNNIFKGIDNPFIATRYHSLIVDKNNFPPDLKIIAWTSDDEIMAIKHNEYPIYGLQFHPESILSEYGFKIIENFIKTSY
ncbi:MAG TPA: aminodeoxychorismate/anthranilate synthase component II [Halanaerobiales bacterium]|nr:aminodeoxychorismate/anthranilate synthase component II [Halanaerobiales bacterium]